MPTFTTPKPLLLPTALNPGDVIAVCSPAAPSSADAFAEGEAYLKAKGFIPKIMPHAKANQYYLAGSVEGRVADLHAAFADPEVKGILCARGGYGSMHLLPHLNWELIAANPKVFIGFSDVTSLVLPMYQRTGLVGFHGPMLTSGLIEQDAYCDEQLWPQVLGQVSYPHAVHNLATYHCFNAGVAQGPLLGGNLSLLTSLCGTPYQPDFTGAVVFIEDWYEPYYRLDRKFTQLQLAGVLDNIAGLILADFTSIADSETWPDYPLEALLQDLTRFCKVPMGWGLSVGHGDQTMTLPIGVPARFEATSGRLEILSAPVAPACP